MSEATRRAFLTTSGFGVAAAGVAAIGSAGTVAAGPTALNGSGGLNAAGLAAAGTPLVAFVRDVHGAEMSLMVGEQEIVVHDRELVGRLLRATTR